MSEEEILRKKLERLNENSHYGIMIDTEITKIVRSHIKRLEEATMHADCEFCLKRDICTKDVPKPCRYRYTEEERIADQAADRVGVILNATYLPSTYHKKEDNEMKKATSVQNIKNVNGVSFLIENHPMEEESKLTIVASTNDDIFEFEFEGSDLLQSCKAAGLFTGWEKDQKIKELEKKISELEALKTPTIENFADEEPSDQPKTDNVNHPSHYETGKFECIEVMQEVFGTAAVMSFCKGNAFKYVYRMDRKNGIEDAKKAIWYLNKYLELYDKWTDEILDERKQRHCYRRYVNGGYKNGGKKSIPEGE